MLAILDLKEVVKRAEPCKCDKYFVSRILQHKRVIHFLKEWRY